MENIIKLILLASGIAGLLLYPMGNLIIIMPSIPLISSLGIDANFLLGFLFSIIILAWLSIPRRYSWNIGFIFLSIGLLSFLGFQMYQLELSIYSLKLVRENGFNFKYFIEFIIFIFNFLGLIVVYHSNLPKIIVSDEQEEEFK